MIDIHGVERLQTTVDTIMPVSCAEAVKDTTANRQAETMSNRNRSMIQK